MKRCTLEARLVQVKDVLPLAEEILRYGITISELLALHSAAVEKAEVEKVPLDQVCYKIVEDIRDYSQLDGLKQEQDRLQQQIFIYNMFMATRQAALMSLICLHMLGVRDEEIVGMAQMINLDKLGASL